MPDNSPSSSSLWREERLLASASLTSLEIESGLTPMVFTIPSSEVLVEETDEVNWSM